MVVGRESYQTWLTQLLNKLLLVFLFVVWKNPIMASRSDESPKKDWKERVLIEHAKILRRQSTERIVAWNQNRYAIEVQCNQKFGISISVQIPFCFFLFNRNSFAWSATVPRNNFCAQLEEQSNARVELMKVWRPIDIVHEDIPIPMPAVVTFPPMNFWTPIKQNFIIHDNAICDKRFSNAIFVELVHALIPYQNEGTSSNNDWKLVMFMIHSQRFWFVWFQQSQVRISRTETNLLGEGMTSDRIRIWTFSKPSMMRWERLKI